MLGFFGDSYNYCYSVYVCYTVMKGLSDGPNMTLFTSYSNSCEESNGIDVDISHTYTLIYKKIKFIFGLESESIYPLGKPVMGPIFQEMKLYVIKCHFWSITGLYFCLF